MLHVGDDIEFFATDWRAEMLRMFQLSVTSDPSGAKLTHQGYETAVKNRSPLSYLEWMTIFAEQCGRAWVTIRTWAAYEEAGLLFRGPSTGQQGMVDWHEAIGRLLQGNYQNDCQPPEGPHGVGICGPTRPTGRILSN